MLGWATGVGAGVVVDAWATQVMEVVSKNLGVLYLNRKYYGIFDFGKCNINSIDHSRRSVSTTYNMTHMPSIFSLIVR